MTHDLALIGYWTLGLVLAALVIWVLFLWFRLVWRALDGFGGALRDATTPVPSPQEISAKLAAHYGRPATVEEVGAVHQILHDRHTDALITSGLGLGAGYLLLRP